MKRAPIWRSDDYERMLAWHGASPSEIEHLRARREPEPPVLCDAATATAATHVVTTGPAIEQLFYMRQVRPTLKELTDAMRADGFPVEAIYRARTNMTKRRARNEKPDSEFEKLFGQTTGGKKTVKKALKAVKKRMV